jgi:hypothetical protein
VSRARPGVVALLALLLAACVSLPESGSVRTRPEEGQAEPGDAIFDFNPSGPRPGASPTTIVEDFLVAMEASPQSTAVAEQFLTADARNDWFPERSTLIYGSRVLTERRGTVVTELDETARLDDRGTWLGPTGGDRGVTYRLELERERGQWRITNPPDALVVPRSHFESRFQQYFVYYFDPTADVLVPQPVYLPRGEVAPTLLVRTLLRGPGRDLRGVVRTFIPHGTELEISVPVSPTGTAEVPLTDEFLTLRGDALQMALAQVAWTLRQVPGIASMRVTVRDSPLEIPGSGAPPRVTGWAEYDPSIHWASHELFGLRNGSVVTLSPHGDRGVGGRFGAAEYSLREIAVDLPAEHVAGVTEKGTSVVVAPRSRDPENAPSSKATTVVHHGGTDLLRPAWDVHGRLWLVDRTRRGARLLVRRADSMSEVEAPGLTGQDVTAFAVSRDGTRLVAVVSGRTRDRLVLARVRQEESGAVQGLTAARALPLGSPGLEEIRDVAWRTPASLAVLTGPTRDTSQVLVALVDGSSDLTGAEPADVFGRRAVRLVASPSPETALYLGTTHGQLFELAADGQWIGPRFTRPLTSPGYVG